MRIHKSEKLWAVSIEGPSITGGRTHGFYDAACDLPLIFSTKKECKQWIEMEFRRLCGSNYHSFRDAKPRPCRVLVTVEGER